MTKKYFDNMPDKDAMAIENSAHGFPYSRFLNTYKKIFNGASMASNVLSLEKAQLNLGIFGDSMGGFKGMPLKDLFVKTLGKRGDVYSSTPIISGDAYNHTDWHENTYWFTGKWSGILNGNGTITFSYGGGGITGNRLRIYYVKESGAGTFKVQTSTDGINGTYNDVAGYTSVDCNNATTEAAVLDITLSSAKHILRIVGLTGDVVVLFATMENTSAAGVMYYNFTQGGLSWDEAANCPDSILTPVFTDIELDLLTFEAKESELNITNHVSAFFDTMLAAYANTDMILCASTPQLNDDATNVAANAALKSYAESKAKYYFDGYSPLINYQTLVNLGWEGDGTHPDVITGFFLASILFQRLGFNNIFYRPISNDIRNALTVSEEIQLSNLESGAIVGHIIRDEYDNDVRYRSKRGHIFSDMNDNAYFSATSSGLNGFGYQIMQSNGMFVIPSKLKAANLQTYADNTSAISGGLSAGQCYKTATGELRIVI